MAPPGPPFQALTIRHNGLSDRLLTSVSVCEAYDPHTPPSPLPPYVDTEALWDTGATRSVISPDLAKALKLVSSGQTNVTHAGGSSQSPTYVVNFKLPSDVTILGAQVTEFAKQPGDGFDVILGMDVITVGDFSITNVGGQTWMSFRTPSMVAIDYVAEHNKLLYAGVPRNAPCPCGSGQKFKKCHGV